MYATALENFRDKTLLVLNICLNVKPQTGSLQPITLRWRKFHCNVDRKSSLYLGVTNTERIKGAIDLRLFSFLENKKV